MKLKKKFKMILLFVGIIILGFILIKMIFHKGEDYYVVEVNPSDFYDILESKEKQVVIVYRDGCYQCDEYLSNARKIAKDYRVKFHYLNTDQITSDDYNIFDLCKIEGTPSMVILQDNKVVGTLKGSKSKEDVKKFLKKYQMIK